MFNCYDCACIQLRSYIKVYGVVSATQIASFINHEIFTFVIDTALKIDTFPT